MNERSPAERELKRRLLLTKWHDIDAVAQLNEELGNVEEKLAEANETADDLESVLVELKYWLHDGLVLNKPVTSPRLMLTKIERVIG